MTINELLEQRKTSLKRLDKAINDLSMAYVELGQQRG